MGNEKLNPRFGFGKIALKKRGNLSIKFTKKRYEKKKPVIL